MSLVKFQRQLRTQRQILCEITSRLRPSEVARKGLHNIFEEKQSRNLSSCSISVEMGVNKLARPTEPEVKSLLMHDKDTSWYASQKLHNEGHCESWNLDRGLDYGLRFGLDFGLCISVL